MVSSRLVQIGSIQIRCIHFFDIAKLNASHRALVEEVYHRRNYAILRRFEFRIAQNKYYRKANRLSISTVWMGCAIGGPNLRPPAIAAAPRPLTIFVSTK